MSTGLSAGQKRIFRWVFFIALIVGLNLASRQFGWGLNFF